MKKTFRFTALALAVMTSSHVVAQEDDSTAPYQSWLGFHGMYYNADESDKPGPDFMEDGAGFGFEYGWRFDESWAVRGEYTALDLDYAQINGSQDSVSGHMFGVDAMYFMPDDLWYLFGGVKRQILDDNYNLANVGIGKHWDLNDDVQLTTELAAYRDFDDSYYDYSVKIGVSFPFGKVTETNYTAPAPVVDGDSDNDGVLNSQDMCPNTPAGTEVDSKGCAVIVDSDNDGVADSKDMCPDTPMTDKVDADGCTVFDQEEITHTLHVQFANNSAEVSDPHSAEIEEFVDFFKRYGKTQAVIEGHASAPGDAAYNMDLSKRRAEAFKDLLVNEYGIDASRLTAEGFGESQLLMEGSSSEANRVNRRIAIRVTAIVEVPEKR
ncbi:OmpA family protein [Alteromonas sp. 14N.309.X.WAT.G.H12]|uniref:OmpA family protein n=1 Tax=Alteromonas sp. 14N.309.X.WAT.G.H12 TaxID=3120824 RepID=UPI002FD06C51